MSEKQLNLLEFDLFDALTGLVDCLGGAKIVGCKLRPDKSADEAQKWINNCLDRKRREKFDPDDLIRLLKAGRNINCHGLKHFIDDLSGYQRSVPKSLEEEKEDLMRSIKVNQEALAKQFHALGRIEEREKGSW